MDSESNTRPLFMIAGLLVFIVALLAVSKLTGGDETPAAPGVGAPGANPPAGNYQPLPFLPNAPLAGIEGGSPINDTPDVTIVQDIRNWTKNLPLDRNNPKGWTNPASQKPTKSR
jgi:hypothetical protein